MSKPLSGVKIAILVANGFEEDHMTATQRALAAAGVFAKIISSEPGLVNSWTGQAWGHHFAIDAQLNNALGADYAMLVIPGGQRSAEKLKLTAHTKRFINSFMAAGKPVAVWGHATQIMEHAGADIDAANVIAGEGPDFAAKMVEFFTDAPPVMMDQAA